MRIVPLVAAMLWSTAALAQDINIGLKSDPGSLDPTTSSTFVSREVLQSVCDKLIEIDPTGAVTPKLAESWSWSDDGKQLTLKLRDGMVFADGSPVDAEAVRYSLNRHKTLQGSRRAVEFENVAGVEVVDPLTVRLTLAAPAVSTLT